MWLKLTRLNQSLSPVVADHNKIICPPTVTTTQQLPNEITTPPQTAKQESDTTGNNRVIKVDKHSRTVSLGSGMHPWRHIITIICDMVKSENNGSGSQHYLTKDGLEVFRSRWSAFARTFPILLQCIRFLSFCSSQVYGIPTPRIKAKSTAL